MTARPRKDETADDWLSNFNDLSVEAEAQSQSQQKTGTTKSASQKRRLERRKQERKQESLDLPNKSPNEAATFEGLKAKLGYATKSKPSGELGNAVLDDILSQALEGIPKGVDATDNASKDVRQTYESVLADLITEANPAAKDPASEQTDTVFSARGKDNAVGDNNDWPGRKRLPVQSEPNDQTAQKADAGPVGAVDDIQLTGGVTSSSQKPRTSPTQSEDLHYGKPLSIASKARVVRERPKWGGTLAAPDDAGSSIQTSIASLRKADKVSAAPQRPATAFTATPWGFKGPQTNNGVTDTIPGELADGQNSAHAKTEEPQSGYFGGMLGFKKLKNMLYSSTPENKKEVTESEKDEVQASSVGTQHEAGEREGSQTTEAGQTEVTQAKNSSAADVTRASEQEQSDTGAPSAFVRKPVIGSKSTRKRAEQRVRARMRVQQSAGEDAAVAKSTSTPEALTEPADVEPVMSENLDSMLQTPENEGISMADAMLGRELSSAMNSEQETEHVTAEDVDDSESGLPTINAKGLQIKALNIEQPPVPGLAYGLDRTLFNPGVTALQDPHSRVYNFDPYLQHIMPVQDFDFNALQQYKTSSEDSALSELAKAHEKKYVGSTSSMTSTLSHFHYLLSGWRELNLDMLSRNFPEEACTFTQINRAPTSIFLRWKNGTYAIDADKEHDSGNILMMLGKSMEKLLTMSKSEYERYRKSDPREVTEEERNAPEAYEYTTMGDFLMRSQLDAYDPRLPGTGMFDIKTRAIASIRMSTSDYKPMLGYEILTHQGKWESFEREYYDMMRSTMLKYMLQARMGRMDGIFLAYHNVQRIFGFQYMPMAEIDRALHGQIDRCLGDQEFKLSLKLLNEVLEEATAKFPGKSLRLHFETKPVPVTAMYVFAEPMEDEEIDRIQAKGKDKIVEFERKMMGIEPRPDNKSAAAKKDQTPDDAAPIPLENGTHAPLYAATILVGSIVNGERVERPERLHPKDKWSVEYLLKEMDDPASAWATYAQCKAKRSKVFSKAIMTDDEGGAETLEDAEPNLEMHDEDGSLRTFESTFLELLRQKAEKGREFRRKMDKLEKEKGKVVYGQSAPGHDKGAEVDTTEQQQQAPAAPTDAATGERAVNSVDEYMAWMYANKENQTPSREVDTTAAEPEIAGVDDYMSWMYKGRVW